MHSIKMISAMLVLCFGLLAGTFANSNPISTLRGPKIVFNQTNIDYGSISVHASGLRKFEFKNVGNEALIITDAKASCGCTVPNFPKEAIAPGAIGFIEVRYDTSRIGRFNKTITVTTLDGSSALLTISGEVKAD